jgi:hypothetical protein
MTDKAGAIQAFGARVMVCPSANLQKELSVAQRKSHGNGHPQRVFIEFSMACADVRIEA